VRGLLWDVGNVIVRWSPRTLTSNAAVQALGFHTHHFTDPKALRPALEAAGLL